MTAFTATNLAKLAATPVKYPDSSVAGARLRAWVDEYDASAAQIGDTIAIARLPAGARVVDVIVAHDGLGASVTFNVGDAASASRFLSAGDGANAGIYNMDEQGGFAHRYAAESDVLLTIAGAAATGTIKTVVTYTAPNS